MVNNKCLLYHFVMVTGLSKDSPVLRPPLLAHVGEGQVKVGHRGRLEVPHHAPPHLPEHLQLGAGISVKGTPSTSPSSL